MIESFTHLAAQVCHEANRAIQFRTGDPNPSPAWAWASPEQQNSAIQGVELAISGYSAEQLHEAWCQAKWDTGWEYGTVKDEARKTHPCLVPYDQLPEEQKLKDHIFYAVVKGFKDAGAFL